MPKLIAWATRRLASNRPTSCRLIGARVLAIRSPWASFTAPPCLVACSRARHLGVEQVARAAVGLDDLALDRGVQLAAQAADLHVDRPVEHLGLGAAGLFQQLV